jgi:hypothetical protein
LLAACTDTAATPTAPPDAFGPTPSIEDPTPTTVPRPKPTTTADVQRAIIYPVDPVTLDALPGYEPMLMKDWVWGRPSPNGEYFAAAVGDDTGVSSEIRLIDVPNWKQVGSWLEMAQSEIVVSDDGSMYFLLQSGADLLTLRPGMSESEAIAEIPVAFSPWGGAAMLDESFATFGSRYEAEAGLEHLFIVVADPESGAVTTVHLPDVRVGTLDPTNQEPWSGYLWASPAVVFDGDGGRVLVIHADRDVVTEVDLESGSSVEHVLATGDTETPMTETSLLSRSAQLSPDGSTLYVASQRGDIVVTDDGWTYNQSPAGLLVIDTGTWEIISRLDGTVGDVHLSPSGDTLLAWGYTSVEDASTYQMTSSGLYLLGAMTLATISFHPATSTDQWYGPFSFNEAAGVGYVSTWSGRPRIDVVDLATGDYVAFEEGGEYIEMLGSIGVISKVISG